MELAASLASGPGLRVLALVEATRLTGVARNLLDYARLGRMAMAGVPVALALALIRRSAVVETGSDRVQAQAADAGLSVDVLVERYRYDLQVIECLRRLVRAHRPLILETHHVKSHCLVALSGLWRDHTWVAFHHGHTQTDVKVRAYNQVDRWSLRHAAHVITTSRPFAVALAGRGIPPERISVVHNGVQPLPAPPADGAALRHRLGLRPTERVVLTVGRLSHEKGQASLIRAASAWRGQARLVVVGDGPDRPGLERLARRIGVTPAVIFAGQTDDVAPFYAMADVFALPSLSEGSPNVLLEAMACGLPVAATRVGGVPEIAVDGATALLVPPRNPLALARAVDRLLTDADLGRRLGRAARQAVLTDFTPAARAATLSRIYAGLTASM